MKVNLLHPPSHLSSILILYYRLSSLLNEYSVFSFKLQRVSHDTQLLKKSRSPIQVNKEERGNYFHNRFTNQENSNIEFIQLSLCQKHHEHPTSSVFFTSLMNFVVSLRISRRCLIFTSESDSATLVITLERE